MSFFQDKSDFHSKGDDELDVIHLSPHGCDVLFSHGTANTKTTPTSYQHHSRYLIIQGSLQISLNYKTTQYNTGDWFEIPPETEHSIHYLTDCSIIEFWFKHEDA